jgi:hypothetical protein
MQITIYQLLREFIKFIDTILIQTKNEMIII